MLRRFATPLVLALLTISAVGMAGYAIVAYTMFPAGRFVHPEMQRIFSVERVCILAHVFGSAIAMLLCPWQFVPAVRQRWPRAHRWVGRAYLGLGVLPGGLAGLYMAFFAFGGAVSTVGFAVLAGYWLFTGYRGYAAARNGRFDEHRAWMIRNVALTFAAVTLRMQLGVCAGAGLRFEMFYPFLAWTSWVPNVVVAEWIVWRLSARGAGAVAVSVA